MKDITITKREIHKIFGLLLIINFLLNFAAPDMLLTDMHPIYIWNLSIMAMLSFFGGMYLLLK